MVAPQGFDDPDRPSGGNIYDRRVCAGLGRGRMDVRIATVAGRGRRRPRRLADLAAVIAPIPDGETVLIDGLIASPAAAALLPHAGRLRLTVLLHMPLATALGGHPRCGRAAVGEAVLGAAAGVVVTSEWTRQLVLGRFAVAARSGARRPPRRRSRRCRSRRRSALVRRHARPHERPGPAHRGAGRARRDEMAVRARRAARSRPGVRRPIAGPHRRGRSSQTASGWPVC